MDPSKPLAHPLHITRCIPQNMQTVILASDWLYFSRYGIKHNTILYNTMQYSTVQYITNFICHFCVQLYKNCYISSVQGINCGEQL